MATVIPLGLLLAVLKSDAVLELRRGTDTHNPALKLVCSIAPFNDDVEFHREMVHACLPANYTGNTLHEIKDMVAWAVEHGSAREAQLRGRFLRSGPSLSPLCQRPRG